MSLITLTKIRLAGGAWHGLLQGAGADPERLRVTLMGTPVPGLTAEADGADWIVRVPIPVETIAEGVQTFLIHDAADDSLLASFSLVSGEALSDDIRAEVDLLREELDMLKRAFRRHCLETMDPSL